MATAFESERELDLAPTRNNDPKLNHLILAVMEDRGLGWWARLLTSGLAYLMGLVLFGYQTYTRLGVAGYEMPVFWGVYVVIFVFWVGIAHAGTLMSAILYLFRAKWRNAINRLAEGMSVIAVHVGRIWKAHFMLPYPNRRGLWVNFKSFLVWDTFAISTYALISMTFFYVGLLPDLAIARDISSGVRRRIYGVLAMGWTGSSRQWKGHTRTVLLLSGLATPLVLSVHSVVA